MKVVTEQEARTQLNELADAVWDDHDIVVIAREGGRSTVLLSLEDYESLSETAHILRSPSMTAANTQSRSLQIADISTLTSAQRSKLVRI